MDSKIVALLCFLFGTIGVLAGLHFGDHGEKEITALKEGGLATMNELAEVKAAKESCQKTLGAKETELARLTSELKQAKTELEEAKKVVVTKTATVVASGGTTLATTIPGQPETFEAGKGPDPKDCAAKIGRKLKIHRQDKGKIEETYNVEVRACVDLAADVKGNKALASLFHEQRLLGSVLLTNVCNLGPRKYASGETLYICGKPGE